MHLEMLYLTGAVLMPKNSSLEKDADHGERSDQSMNRSVARLSKLTKYLSPHPIQQRQQHRIMSLPSYSLAILDDYADIASKHFRHIPNLTVDSYPETLNPKTPSGLEALVQRLEPYDAVSTMRERTPFPAELLQRLPKLKLLLTTSVRNASIDLDCAKEKGVIVTGTKGSQPPNPEQWDDLPPEPQWTSVNQHTWALLLSLCSRLPKDDAALKSAPAAWQSGLIVPLGGKTLGLVGLGKLGALMARTAVLGFGMKVLAWSENLTQEKADAQAEQHGCKAGEWKAVGKEDLFKQSDVVSVHYVLSPRSRGVVGRTELGMMKRSGILINTSRGPLVDEAGLIQVLKEGKIRGAALDVFDQEPLPVDSEWRHSGEWKSEVVLSPHMGYVNAGTMERWYQEQGEIVESWMKGDDAANQMN